MTHSSTIRSSARLALPLVLLLAACGDDDTTTPIGDTGSDAGTDATGDVVDGDTTDTTPDVPVTSEDLLIAYTQESTFDDDTDVQLLIVDSDCRAGSADLCDPGICDPVEVLPRNPSEPLCNRGCRLTDSLSHIVFLDPDEGQTLRAAPLGSDYQLTADSEIIATGVLSYQVAGQTIAYRVAGDLHIHDLATGADTIVAGFGNSGGGFHLSADASTLFVNDVTSLTAMQTSMVDLASTTVLPIFQFISGEPQGTGSFYSGGEAMALSPDGTRLAVITDARTSGAQCSTSAECTAPGESCLTSATPPRCVRQELTLNVINLNAADRLRTACSSDADCGDDHFCDLTALDAGGQGECLPGRFSLGPSGPTGCTNLQLGQYNGVRGDLAWRGDRTVVGVFSQDCIQGNIPVTDLVALNLDGAAYERIIENPGLDHGQCYDDVEGCFEPEDCVVEIDTTAISASGQTVGMVADSVSTNLKTELWLVDSYGRDGKEILTRSIDWEIRSVSLHPVP